MRRFQLATQWLQERRGLTVDSQSKKDASDRRRIEATLASVRPGSLAYDVLNQHVSAMRERAKDGATTMRSMRLALRPAATLMLLEDAAGARLPSQKTLDAYLASTPGQRAALSGFVGFLGRTFSWPLVVRVDAKRVIQMRRKRLEAEIAQLARGAVVDHDALQRWIQVSLEYFHHLSAHEARRIQSMQTASQVDDGWMIESDGAEYWVPRPVNGVATTP